jgi:FHS family L-fucose permease-like MFS transporter
MNKKVLPILMAFLCMGFGDAAGPLVNLAMDAFGISNTMASLIAGAGFIMFGLISIPMGIVQYRIGKKNVMILGLSVFMLGVLVPVLGLSFPLLLLAVFIMGAGAAILQVAGNPIMRDISPEGKYSRNLSFGQFIKAIGSLSATLIPAFAAGKLLSDYFQFTPMGGTSQAVEWRLMFPIYAAIILFTIILIVFLKVKKKTEVSQIPTTFSTSFKALKNNYILIMVLGIFFYVGAEVSMSSKIAIFFSEYYNVDLSKLGMIGVGVFFLALTIGRFLGSVILNWMKPAKFLVLTSILSILGICLLFFNSITVAWVSVFLIGIGFANIFPLIFSITVDAMPEKTNEISGLMVTAIVGGAVIPLLAGVVADINLQMSFIVPLLCIVYITIIAFWIFRIESKKLINNGI